MSARISWLSLENSLNPFDEHEESSHFMVKNNENSISLLGRYSSLPREEESRSLLHFQAIVDSFLNKNDNIIPREDKFTYGFIFRSNDEPYVEESSLENESEISSSPLEIPQFELKKGLKSLAKLLIKILRKKKFDSSKNLTSEIEEILMKGKKLSKNELARESKNIRRRTYDALNVMVAANVLGPDLAFVKKIHAPNFSKKCGIVVGEKKELENKITELSERIKIKRNLLKKLSSKKSSIEWWIRKKKNESLKFDFNQEENSKIFKNAPSHIFNIKNEKISFPAIFISSVDDKGIDDLKIESENEVRINSKKTQIKLFSEIDAFEILKCEEEAIEESPFQLEKSRRLDFRSFEIEDKDKSPEREFTFKFFSK